MTVRFLGTTDSVDACDCCGRTGLKRTVVLLYPQADEPVHFGTSCAARALSMPARVVTRCARGADQAHADALDEERRRVALVEFNAFQTWLDRQLPHLAGRRIEQLAKLNGYSAAREWYERDTARWNREIAALRPSP